VISPGERMKKILILCSCVFLVIGINSRILAADSTEFPDLLQDEYLEDDFDTSVEGKVGQVDIYDPLEPLNRVFFEFNDKLYFWVLKPAKTGYTYAVPTEFRQCFRNFFNNLFSPIRLVNNILQGRFGDAGVVISRLLINSTAGVFGFADAAFTEYGLEPRYADFGQTLALYGFGEGIYINWPALGSSHIRSSFGFIGDGLANPVSYLDMTIGQRVAYLTTRRINSLSLRPGTYEDLVKYSLDPYITVRQSFYDFRRNVVQNRGVDSFD
jgi:phospholipid-binding lipoprotein MlaA